MKIQNIVYSIRKFSSINHKQMHNFNQIKSWWDPLGPMHILYQYNYHRTAFLKSSLIKYSLDMHPIKPLSKLQILDVGCGAGILSQSLARMGGNVTAIDPNPNSINQACQHKGNDRSLANLNYEQTTIQQLMIKSQKKYDVVTSMQVVQHVQNAKKFIEDISKITKPGGFIMLSTISKSFYSYLTHILIAQYIVGIVPKGTHDHSKFLNIQELEKYLKNSGNEILDHLILDLDFSGKFKTSQFGSNYLIIARKVIQNTLQ